MKTDIELINVSNKIIELLNTFDPAEKYKVISSLHKSLIETIESMGGVIFEND